MGIELLPDFVREKYEVHEWKHACAILKEDFPDEWNDILSVLTNFRLNKSWITNPGGRKSKVSEFIDGYLYARGWIEKEFQTQVVVDQNKMDTPTHKVDCFRNRVALEIEWNNKDPFYDRDLNNFRLLFDLRAISVGVIITRCDDLQDIFNERSNRPSAAMRLKETRCGEMCGKVEYRDGEDRTVTGASLPVNERGHGSRLRHWRGCESSHPV